MENFTDIRISSSMVYLTESFTFQKFYFTFSTIREKISLVRHFSLATAEDPKDNCHYDTGLIILICLEFNEQELFRRLNVLPLFLFHATESIPLYTVKQYFYLIL